MPNSDSSVLITFPWAERATHPVPEAGSRILPGRTADSVVNNFGVHLGHGSFLHCHWSFLLCNFISSWAAIHFITSSKFIGLKFCLIVVIDFVHLYSPLSLQCLCPQPGTTLLPSLPRRHLAIPGDFDSHNWGGRCYWQAVGRDQGCCEIATIYRTAHSKEEPGPKWR